MTVLSIGVDPAHIAQSVPTWAVNTVQTSASLPNLWALRLAVGAGKRLTEARIALYTKDGASGNIQVAIYDDEEGDVGDSQLFPVAVSLPTQVASHSTAQWLSLNFPEAVEARAADRFVWLMLAMDVKEAEFPVARPDMWLDGWSSHDVFSANSATAPPRLPAYFDLAGFKQDHRVPLVALI